jgi:hypothetical protein
LGDLEALIPLDLPVLDFVRQHDRGLIRYNPERVRPARLIAQIAKAWPQLGVVVTATRPGDAGRLHRSLSKILPHATLFNGPYTLNDAGQVAIATYSHLGLSGIGIRFRDLYIALNPWELFYTYTNCGVEGVDCLHRGRLFGLMPDGLPLDPLRRDLVTALFGVEEVRVPGHGLEPVQVDVAFLPLSGGGGATPSDELGFKRNRLWHHPLRNRRIAQLAQALAIEDSRALAENFPEVAWPGGVRDPGRVGVLVENVEHALALHRYLPDWPVVAARDAWVGDLPAGQRRALELGSDTQRAKTTHAIVTTVGVARAGRFGTLIRADGGTGLPPFPKGFLATCGPRGHRLLLIDFIDRDHPVTRRRSRVRRTAYREAGWRVAGERERTPLERFLAGRRGVLS